MSNIIDIQDYQNTIPGPGETASSRPDPGTEPTLRGLYTIYASPEHTLKYVFETANLTCNLVGLFVPPKRLETLFLQKVEPGFEAVGGGIMIIAHVQYGSTSLEQVKAISEKMRDLCIA